MIGVNTKLISYEKSPNGLLQINYKLAVSKLLWRSLCFFENWNSLFVGKPGVYELVISFFGVLSKINMGPFLMLQADNIEINALPEISLVANSTIPCLFI